ncbi:Myb-like DNA-binding domain protein [Dictyocaulus viviparus]|uniref:Myb-like DNA-binding domain protein n=1 Tax=Dictyocaulus viviparus TaxID=29172 RepID=A0A0D8X972_DICVI|nr:Myb-like DNA-binding domain protein [Dictyocaulus viviparus]
MDVTSTSFDFFASHFGDGSVDGECTNLVPVSNEEFTAYNCDAADPCPEVLGLIQAQIEFCDQMLFHIEVRRKRLAEKKALIEKRIAEEHRQESTQRNRVPVLQYLPPYFKDDNMMCPPLNEEAKHKLRHTTFDPLIKEDKKCKFCFTLLIMEVVMSQAGIQKFIDRYGYSDYIPLCDFTYKFDIAKLIGSSERNCSRKEILCSKIQRAGVETAAEELETWKKEVDALNRKIQHSRAGQIDSQEMDVVGYSCVDWLKISAVEFEGSRSAAALRYKWLNEQCPRWNSGPWTKQELERLKELCEESSFTSWAVLAKKLGTQRSPYQCFERYRSDMYRMAKDWTKEEDDRLVALVKVMTVNGSIQWDKVCFYMPGRHRQQVRTRYQRTLDENVRHGRWTDHEDLLLMSAVARFGAKDWAKVAKAVIGRSDGQCRERWCNVLDRCTEAGDWTAEEDERLVFGVQVFGRGQWSKIAEILPRHTPETIRRRYQRLIAKKMRLCSAKLVGYPVVDNMSSISATIHKAKRDVMIQQLTDSGLKGECYRAAKEQAQKNPSRKLANVVS